MSYTGSAADAGRKWSIRTILLWTIIFWTVVTLGLLTAFFSVMQYRTLKNQATEEMRSYCESTASALGQQIKEMDTILLYSMASSKLKEDFNGFMTADTSFEKYRARQELAGAMITLKGFDFSIRQFNIYDAENGGYGVGNYNGGLINSVRDEPWYDKTKALAGKKYIYAPAANRLASKASGMDENTLYLCLCRMFYDDLHVPMGFMIVETYYDEIFGKIGYKGRELNPTIAIYDNDGRQIYPEAAVFPYFTYRDREAGEMVNTYTGKKQYLCFSEDEADGLTVAMAVDDEVFMLPVYRSLRVILFTVVLLLVGCMLLAAALSKRMSDPIRRMYVFLTDPGRRQFERLELGNSGVEEIDKLRDSLNESIQAQESATNTMLTLKEQEMQAQMLALQSQMNPHFLFNSLTMIGEMAESGMTDQVSEMCEDITSILRYISSNRKQRIRVEEEMEQVDRYLNCMKRRFGDGLLYSYDIVLIRF